MTDIWRWEQGMALRDYFAIRCLDVAYKINLETRDPEDDLWASELAIGAYKIADVMLWVREKDNKKEEENEDAK